MVANSLPAQPVRQADKYSCGEFDDIDVRLQSDLEHQRKMATRRPPMSGCGLLSRLFTSGHSD